MIAPAWTLELLRFETVEALSARLVGAALIGIGTTSLIVRNKSQESFKSLLTLKIIWSASAMAGIIVSIIQDQAPQTAWLIFAIFLIFLIVWSYYYKRLLVKI